MADLKPAQTLQHICTYSSTAKHTQVALFASMTLKDSTSASTQVTQAMSSLQLHCSQP